MFSGILISKVIYIKENNSKKEFDLILKDETNYDKEEKNILKLKSNYVDFEKSIEKLKKFCELREIETNKFMEEAVELIELDDQHIGDLKDCFVNNTNVYQVMYKMVTQYDNRNELPKNILCSFINYEKELLFNNCILMNTFINFVMIYFFLPLKKIIYIFFTIISIKKLIQLLNFQLKKKLFLEHK